MTTKPENDQDVIMMDFDELSDYVPKLQAQLDEAREEIEDFAPTLRVIERSNDKFIERSKKLQSQVDELTKQNEILMDVISNFGDKKLLELMEEALLKNK